MAYFLVFRLSQALQGCTGWQWGERLYSSGEGSRLTLRTAAKGMREHVYYLFTSVVQASELKALRAGEGLHTQAFWRRREEEKRVFRIILLCWPSVERTCPADSQPLSCRGFPRP